MIMICPTLFLCVAAIIFAALACHPTARVSAFSTNAPARQPPTAGGGVVLLKGSISSSASTGTALYATKKGSSSIKKEKSTTTKKSAAATAPKKKKKPAAEDEDVDDDEIVKFKKADFVTALAEKTGMTKTQSDLALTTVFNVIATVSGCTVLLCVTVVSNEYCTLIGLLISLIFACSLFPVWFILSPFAMPNGVMNRR